LLHPKTSSKVSLWLARLPPWLELRAAASDADGELMRLDPGEREAIQLALELGINTVLLDEADGRQLAEKLHLQVRGTLGILERARGSAN
jgi:predicted nucleic acid-binding protein